MFDVAAAVSASGTGVQLCPSSPGGDAATFGTASLAAGPPLLSLPCLVRPADGRVRRGLPARVDVIVLPAGGFLSFYL